jgi:DNA helicase HerA-like ATPase
MDPDRKIGQVVKVKTYQTLVELLPDTSSYTKSSFGGLFAIAAINSYVIIPIGSERVVGIVTGLDMVEDAEAGFHNKQMLILPTSRRTMWVAMVGTISQSLAGGEKQFEYGIRRYPELNNPVWYASEDDLDVIFEKRAHDPKREKRLISIGKSPLFPDYDVRIDIDGFFGKHAAILGNTGSGKSCTVTAIINAVMNNPDGNGMPHAHFIIFDTNAEYEAAFTKPAVEDAGAAPTLLYKRLVITNQASEPSGFWVPHWFMNGRDYVALFHPGEGAQTPLLHRAISAARSTSQSKAFRIEALASIEDSLSAIEGMLENPPTGNQAGFGLAKLLEQVQALDALLDRHTTDFAAAGLAESFQVYKESVARMRVVTTSTAQYPQITALTSDGMRPELELTRAQLATDRVTDVSESLAPVGIDSPVYFSFDELVERVFRDELAREARANPNLRNWVGPLLMRLEQARQDPRYRFLFKTPRFEDSLASFLRLIFGVNPSENFGVDGGKPPWQGSYETQFPAAPPQHNVTILDFSQLASDVLENVTALIARLILEFMQFCPARGQYPVVLVLEEAHRYIPAQAPLERQQRAREIFERIAKEGRKYGLSLLVASQRPSELSRTVLAQCNSFIAHRIQNPDDREYFKSVISSMNRELLDQLPVLPQQHALVLGDCVTIPLQVRLNDVDPKPNSNDPQFFETWSNPSAIPPDFESICAQWEGRPVNTSTGEVVVKEAARRTKVKHSKSRVSKS